METKDIILELRTKRGMSQDELAQKLFVTRQAVSRWETGETVPNTETLKLLRTFRLKTCHRHVFLTAKPTLGSNPSCYYFKIQAPISRWGLILWRRRRDLNPRTPYGCYTISNRARSAGLRDFSEYKTIFRCSACVL